MKDAQSLENYLLRVISGEIRGFQADVIKSLLSILELVYLVLWKINSVNRFKRQLPVPVISIGNITAGGTGKTPTVVWLADFFIKQGLKPAILTRGYRRHNPSQAIIFTQDELSRLNPEETGDEPYLMAQLLPGVPVGVGRDRFQTGVEALKKYPQTDLFLLDDGFQYRKLERQLDILLLDARNPFGFGHLIPRGLLREPLSGLKRADLIFITRWSELPEQNILSILHEIKRHHSDAPVIRVSADNSTITHLNSDQILDRLPVDELKGKRVGVVTAIGNPDQFKKTVEKTGAIIHYFGVFSDHHYWTETEIDSLIGTLLEKQLHILVITAKDSVKLKSAANQFKQNGITCYIVNLEFRITDENALAIIKKVGMNKRG